MTEDKAGTYNILRMLIRGKTKFSELLEYVPRQTLSERLQELEKSGYVERSILDTRPPRPEYSITLSGKNLFRRMAFDKYKSHLDDVFLIAPTEAAKITDEYLKERSYQPKKERVRPLEAVKPPVESLRPKVEEEILSRSSAIGNELGVFLDDTMPLRVFNRKETATLKRAKKILVKDAKVDSSGIARG